MKKLDLPDRSDCLQHVDTAFKYVNGTNKYVINSDELRILNEIYDEYDKLEGTANDTFKSNKLSDYLNEALEDSYAEIQDRGRLKDLRETLLLAINRCPYCGISGADELDHHLPKSIYRSISIYNRNLIPLCHKCNNKKRSVDGTDDKKFPHVYFDNYLNNHFFIADTKMKSNALIIQFKVIEDNLLDDEFNVLNFLFKRVNLNERLLKECNIYLSSFSISLENSFVNFQIDGVREFLVSQYHENQRIFGINDWRTALIKSLSTCDDFCDGGFRHYYNNVTY